MTRQAQVGAFAILALLLLFGVFYVITDFGTRHSGYRVGVHFDSAAGITSGATVYFSGVTAGTVDSIVLLPDNSVDVILAIDKDIAIPRASRFLIQAPLTGSPSLLIVPPKSIPGVTPAPGEMLPQEVLPVAMQPYGYNSATIGDLLTEGQGEIRRLDTMLAEMEAREPRLLATMQATLENADALTSTANASVASLLDRFSAAADNVVALTDRLNRTLAANSPQLSDIVTQLDRTSIALNRSAQSLQRLASNPDLKTSLIATAKNIQDTTATIAALTHDLRTVTGDPNTQAQIRNAVANLDAASQRASSILGNFGGQSCVYGVDACGTPAPSASPSLPYGSPLTPSGPNGAPEAAGSISTAQKRSSAGGAFHNMVSLQLRESGLSPQHACCANPLLSRDRGPQTDINALLFPNAGTSFLVGANDIGYHTTANAALLKRLAPGFRAGGGVLYSQLGVIGQYNARAFGFEGRLYNPRYATLDLYGNINVTHGASVFFGQRDVLHAERRNVYGLQLQF